MFRLRVSGATASSLLCSHQRSGFGAAAGVLQSRQALFSSSSSAPQDTEASPSSSSEKSDTSPVRQIGRMLEVQFDSPGTGRFVAFGNARSPHDHVSLVMTCDVSDRMLVLQEHWREQNANAPTVSGKLLNKKRRGKKGSHVAPMSADDEEARIPAPVSFTVFMEQPQKEELHLDADRQQQHPSSSSRGSSMCLLASCVGGTLSLDGVSFINSIREALDRSVASVIARRDLYQGPLLHQGQLSECALNTSFTPSPVAVPRQHREFSLRPNFSPRHSPAARYGHMPVHTLRPHVYDALFEWCSALGINDEFARDVNSVALDVQERELRKWQQSMKEVLVRHRG